MPLATDRTAQDTDRYAVSLRDELGGAPLYAPLADAQRDPLHRDPFRPIAQVESNRAQVWGKKMLATALVPKRFTPSLRTPVLARVARRFGTAFVLPSIAAAEFADRDEYAIGKDGAILAAEVHGHGAGIAAAASSSGPPGKAIGRAEPWHRCVSGNNRRATVVGANDGLVSNFCLMMESAAARTSTHTVLRCGLAGNPRPMPRCGPQGAPTTLLAAVAGRICRGPGMVPVGDPGRDRAPAGAAPRQTPRPQ